MKNISKQRGAALLVFVTMLVTATAAVALKALNSNSVNSQIERDRITAAALAEAKDALIGYAITYGESHPGNVHGYLPCPDIDGTNFGVSAEGIADPVCDTKNVSAIGRLPWKTLDLSTLRGGDGECLWYAVSGAYKNYPKTGLMNWDTNGQLQVYASDGTTLLTPADNQAVAVIFAPGTASQGQDRSGTMAPVCGGNYRAGNYLDTVGAFNNATVSGTANANSQFRVGNPSSPSGDRMVFITKQDIWNAMQKRKDFTNTLMLLTQRAAECVADYGKHNKIPGGVNTDNKSLPWPAPLSLTDYADNTQYNDSHDPLYSGRLPNTVNNSNNTTDNTMSGDRLMPPLNHDGDPVNNGLVCPRENDTNTPTELERLYPWWINWKDHLFYAISQRFHPDSSSTSPCDSDHCLSVNGTLGRYAAVVIFAGQKLTGQTRTDKRIVSNYLEGSNASNVANSHANGNENYLIASTSPTFNDIVYCIKQDLTVVKGTASGCP